MKSAGRQLGGLRFGGGEIAVGPGFEVGLGFEMNEYVGSRSGEDGDDALAFAQGAKPARQISDW